MANMPSRRRSARARLLAGAALCLSLFALPTAPARAQDSAWAGGDANAKALAALYAEAQQAKQGKVVVYGGYSALFKPLWEVFSKRYPAVEIVPNPLSGARLVSKLDAEFASGQHEADILMAGMTELLSTVSKDRAQPFRPPNVGALPARYVDGQGRFVIQFADVFGMVYNTAQMKTADLPKTLADLGDPKYKGMVIDNPLAGGLTTLTWIELYNSGKLDGKTMKALRDNASVVPSVTPFYANLSTGSIKLIPWGSFTRYIQMKEAGAPVGYHAVPGMVVPLYGGTAILKGAPNPKAAQLFQAWFVTPEAQNALITRGYSFPLLPGVNTPAGWPVLKDLVDSLKVISPADYTTVRGRFESAVKDSLK
ncbi:ABC transporter substrate-binding protein [Ramlibacter sp.]|uniref:ABC transporter substrate-binding protein n=1 Tax=Ramlibacter sp. TaxID=1917967 RepID=UPI003D10CFE8